MQRFGGADLFVLLAFVALLLDSRRLHALTRSTGRSRRRSISERRIPAGADPEQVGLPLRQIQMRHHVDWQDGGIGWEGPEVLEPDEPADAPVAAETAPGVGPSPYLPVVWKPFPALLAAGVAADVPDVGCCGVGEVIPTAR